MLNPLTRCPLFTLLAVSTFAFQMLAPVSRAVAKQPNLVVILCDDLGYGDLECYGHPHIKTPNLNQLADSGIRLTHCYSAAPVCSPSRVGLLTGRSPNRAGVYDWIPEGNREKADLRDLVHMRDQEVTMAKLLRQAGYATCMSGKWHCNSRFNSDQQPQPGDAGFDHWFGTQNNASPSHENPRNFVRNGERVGPLEGFSCQLAAKEASQWIEQHHSKNQDQPFFLYLAFHEPHEPIASPAELVEEYREVAETEDQAQYFANVANMDHAVGQVVETLKSNNLFEDTFIVFTSDNGPETLNRYKSANRSYGSPGPLRGMKLWTTDAGFRVAGILHCPDHLQNAQLDASQVVSSLDLLPTFCELAGVEVPADLKLDGTSLVPWLQGLGLQRTKPLVWCYFNAINEQRVAMRDGPWKVLASIRRENKPFGKRQNLSVQDRDTLLETQLTDFQMFRVADDIGEEQDLTAENPTLAKKLKEKLDSEYRALLQTSHYWERTE